MDAFDFARAIYRKLNTNYHGSTYFTFTNNGVDIRVIYCGSTTQLTVSTIEICAMSDSPDFSSFVEYNAHRLDDATRKELVLRHYE